MERGRPGFPPDFPCPVVLTHPTRGLSLSPTGLSPSAAAPPRVLRLGTGVLTRRGACRPPRRAVQPPRPIGRQATQGRGFGLFPGRSPLLGESLVISVRGVLGCFRSPHRPPSRDPGGFPGGLPHSDIGGSPGARPLPAASRSRATSFVGPRRLGIHRLLSDASRASAPSLLRFLVRSTLACCALGKVPSPFIQDERGAGNPPRPIPCLAAVDRRRWRWRRGGSNP